MLCEIPKIKHKKVYVNFDSVRAKWSTTTNASVDVMAPALHNFITLQICSGRFLYEISIHLVPAKKTKIKMNLQQCYSNRYTYKLMDGMYFPICVYALLTVALLTSIH